LYSWDSFYAPCYSLRKEERNDAMVSIRPRSDDAPYVGIGLRNSHYPVHKKARKPMERDDKRDI
jgi:hypothetical protein